MACAAPNMLVLPRAGAALSGHEGARSARCLFRARSVTLHAGTVPVLRGAVQPGARGPMSVVASGASERSLVAMTRRDVLAVVAAVPLAVRPALAEDETSIFYGAAQPPATYGGVGGCKKEQARYSLLIPSSFKEEAVSKVEKGSQGIDAKFTGPRKATIKVITLRNEGSRDGVGFTLKDPESALKSVSGSDFTLQDALATGELKTGTRENGFTYDVEGPTCLAIGLATTKDGRLFAVSVSAPSSAWSANAALYKSVRDSFTTYLLAE